MRQTHRVDELHADLGDAFARQYFQKAHETFENLQEEQQQHVKTMTISKLNLKQTSTGHTAWRQPVPS